MKLTQLREAKGWSRAKLAREAELNPATVGRAESRREVPYDGQLQRMADALGYEGEPRDLLDDVE